MPDSSSYESDNQVFFSPFNSSFECGIRLVCLLEAAYPNKLDMEHLVAFDHFIVHTSDIDGPESLHPTAPGHAKELAVRRKLIENGLSLMMSKGLLICIFCDEGIEYQASDKLPAFLKQLREPYSLELQQRANWLIRHFKKTDLRSFRDMVRNHIDIWTLEVKDTERFING